LMKHWRSTASTTRAQSSVRDTGSS